MLIYLWLHRERPAPLSGFWFKAWAKRALTLPGLVSSICKQAIFRMQGARIGNGVFVAPCKFIGRKANLTVGDNSFVGRTTFHLHDRVDVGRNVVINDGVIFFTASHDVRSERFATTTAPIVVADYAWIASSAILLPGSRIGVAAVVGAGAVVRGEIPDFRIAIGNPANLLDHTRAHNLNYNPIALTAVVRAWLGNNS